jgi:hypothetical protein|tara:strand:- start:1382 stop:1528 length:147 start_codon:yes stop_codon:yes gene_type:complete
MALNERTITEIQKKNLKIAILLDQLSKIEEVNDVIWKAILDSSKAQHS